MNEKPGSRNGEEQCGRIESSIRVGLRPVNCIPGTRSAVRDEKGDRWTGGGGGWGIEVRFWGQLLNDREVNKRSERRNGVANS